MKQSAETVLHTVTDETAGGRASRKAAFDVLALLAEVTAQREAAKKIDVLHEEIVQDYVAQLEDLDAARFTAETRVVRLEEALRISYPMTPVDCLISELREIVQLEGAHTGAFEDRVAAFKEEVSAAAALGEAGKTDTPA